MEERGTAADGKVLDAMVGAEAVGDDVGVVLVLTHLDLLLVKPDVEADIRLLEINHVEVVYKHIGEYGTQKGF